MSFAIEDTKKTLNIRVVKTIKSFANSMILSLSNVVIYYLEK